MLKKTTARILATVLALVMAVGLFPLSAFAGTENYPDFLARLKQLEVYADEFAAQSSRDPGELVLNFIRTGVDRYQDGNWAALAGQEITVFTEYVAQQDAANGTDVMELRDIVIENFTLPNGNPSDFGHMFGTMNISYVNAAVQSDDLAGWAGDLCDLLYFSALYGHVPPAGTVEEMADYIREHCFGVNADDAFGWDDFYGDMDAYYLVGEYEAGNGSFSDLMEDYFTASLDDVDRAVYFLNHRFPGLTTREEVRTALYNAYRTNVGIQILEADRGISDYSTMRQASCYALADYLFDNAEGNLNEGGNEGDDEDEEKPENGYYSVFSTTSSVLAPGISQDIHYAMSADGKQMVYYVATVDVNRDDVTIMANYKDNDPSKGWGMQRVEDQVAAMVKNNKHVENFTPVVATNGDGFNTTTGEPAGLLVMNGKVWKGIDSDGFFGILKDGSAIIGTKAEYDALSDEVVEGIGGFGSGKFLVWDGELASGATDGTRASRTAIGIKADGSVVMMVLDGRQEPFSCGGSLREIAQIMLEAGCVRAVNLDGGGSTTYMSKPEGSDQIKVVNRPSDGYARSVSGSLVAVSTAKSSKEFDRAIIESEYEYLTVGTELKMNAIGVNNIGSSAEIPAGSYWSVSDETIGTIDENGVFTAADYGDVEINFVVNGVIAGTKTLHVVIPETLEFTEKSLTLIYDKTTTLPLLATHSGKPVKMNENDIFCGYLEEDPEAEGDMWPRAIFEGFNVTPRGESGARKMTVFAIVLENEEAYCEVSAAMFREDEATFDFDKATAGNRTLAWIREVLNTTTTDNFNYTVADPSKNVTLGYTFALDMNTIEIPAQMADIVFMLPNSDNQGDSAFGYMLALAERVSVLTEVRITAQFDKDLDVDVSGLKVVNDYFALSSATVDENNLLTMVFNWIDRTEAIDVATANPLCIMSGIKATPKDGAWDGNEMVVANSGNVSYDVYLRASSLYSFAQKKENQVKYGLMPYSSSETGWEGGTETGAHYASVYADFEDGFIIDNAVRQGWYKEDGEYKYYVDHQAVTGVQYIPSREDEATKLFYEFDENGVCLGKMTGTVNYGDGLYYAVNGVMTTGWVSGYDAEGNQVDYYFLPSTGRAVNGQQKIGGYNYTFTDYVLTRGDLVKDANGTRYRWAGQWVHGKWFQVDGNWYATKKYVYYVQTGFVNIQNQAGTAWQWFLFDENGVWQKDYTGLYRHDGEVYYILNGIRNSTVGLVEEDGYYYFISADNAKAYRNRTAWINKTNGLVPAGRYTFDNEGRMTNPPSVKPEDPDVTVKNGIVEENGGLYYYVNNVLQQGIGVVMLTDEQGKPFYIYVRSNGQLAVGSFWVADGNGLLEVGQYVFDVDGRYYKPEDQPITPEVKNGIYLENGKYYYYVNGVMQKGTTGVVKLTDELGLTYYIYVCSNGNLATGNYWPTYRNDLLPRGSYDWGTDGKYYPPAVDPDAPVKNGIYLENGKYYYYVDGVMQKGATGVVKLTDDEGKIFYIYVCSTGNLATGKYWPTYTNDLLPRGEYDWGTDGKYYPPAEEPEQPEDPDQPEPEVKNGIYLENGKYYYYVDGVMQKGATGVVKLTDEEGKIFYIYVCSTGNLATGKYWPTYRNDLLPRGEYDWGTDGRYYPA
ncbi:MAG: phosphodiester glycosidase family protein [Clostridia bacterium]|nr:phosphodiester glycosidase family protein [Clostridia bacterium]